MDLLNGCPPALRAELTRYLLRETLGKLPLFKQFVDPEFQGELFPIIKPVSFEAGERIFSKGEISRELLFLLDGEIDVLSVMQEDQIDRRLTPTEEIFLAAAKHEAERAPDGAATEATDPFAISHTGAFGETVLTGQRRRATHVARTMVQTLVASKTDLEAVFANNPRTARRIFSCVMSESLRKERLHSLTLRLLIGVLRRRSELWAVLCIQLAWRQFSRRLCSMAAFFEFEADSFGTPTTTLATHNTPPTAVVPPPQGSAPPARPNVLAQRLTRAMTSTDLKHKAVTDDVLAGGLYKLRQDLLHDLRAELRSGIEALREELVEIVVAAVQQRAAEGQRRPLESASASISAAVSAPDSDPPASAPALAEESLTMY